MRALTLVLCTCVASLATGCKTFRTTDGFEFSSTTGRESVRRSLGPPDLIDEHEHWGFGHFLRTRFTYLDRGYVIAFRDGSVSSVTPITDATRPEIARRVRVSKEEVPKVAHGESAASVISHLGPPDFVVIEYTEDGIRHGVYTGPYAGQLHASPAPETVFAYWRGRGLLVTFASGRAAKVEAMADWHWRQVLHEEPPRE